MYKSKKALVRVALLANVCITTDQISEAGNLKYCYELHARNGLRFTIELQEDVLIVPTSARMG